MKQLLMILTMTTAMISHAQDGKAKTVKKTFNRETSVSIEIDADPTIIWALLTNASDYTRWNSTITSLEGEIEKGGKIRLKSELDKKRTFKLKVKTFDPETQLVWGDGKGNRVFKLMQRTQGKTLFSMTEKIGGLMFPMYAKFIPSFDKSFEQFASDLKKEAEVIKNEN